MTFEVQKLSMPVQPATPMEMLNRALMSGATPETLEKMLALQERWEKNEARKSFDKAIALAKAKIPTIVKNREVSFGAGKTSYRHEDLAEIAKAIVPVLSEFGLSYRFRTNVTDKLIVVTCILSHEGGHSEENSLPGPADTSGSKNAIQSIGSTVTYLQRYTLKAALGLAASNDDDGVSASNGNGELISPKQLDEIFELLDGNDDRIARFCDLQKLDALADMPASRYEAAVAAIKAVNEKITAKAAGGQP